jgi:rare lipoprotein A (peptidoglycan hydrolase)
MQIKINRVAKTTVIVPEAVEYKTVKKSNPNIEKGNKKILQAGANGSKNKYYLVTRQDGVEVSRVFQKSEITKDPVDEIVEVGTKIVTYGSGTATWYKRNQTMVAAHNSLPKGTKVKVINTSNGKSVVVTIDDRGIQGSAIIDLSSDAFAAIASLGSGVANVRIEKYYPPDD